MLQIPGIVAIVKNGVYNEIERTAESILELRCGVMNRSAAPQRFRFAEVLMKGVLQNETQL